MLARQVLVPTHICHQGHLWLIQVFISASKVKVSIYILFKVYSEYIYLQCQGSHWSRGVKTASGVCNLGKVGAASVPVQIIISTLLALV